MTGAEVIVHDTDIGRLLYLYSTDKSVIKIFLRFPRIPRRGYDEDFSYIVTPINIVTFYATLCPRKSVQTVVRTIVRTTV